MSAGPLSGVRRRGYLGSTGNEDTPTCLIEQSWLAFIRVVNKLESFFPKAQEK